MMEALVLEKAGLLRIRDIDIVEKMGPQDVRIAIHTVGICGSDVHYYERGAIGPYVVREPMVLGHEASGTVIEVGREVATLKPGDRVCMEPGVPDPNSRASRLGIYNLDPAVRFWATPPIHGCLRPTVAHPAAFTFKLPDNVSYAEGAMVEPLAVGMHAVNKAHIRPGDTAVVLGLGAIGMLACAAAIAGGCGKVVVVDMVQPKLDLAARLGPVVPVNLKERAPAEVVMEETDGWGADIVFEASGNAESAETVFDLLCPAGRVVFIGCPARPIAFDVIKAQAKEARIETIFRYAHVYPRALSLMSAGKIDVKPFITDRYEFKDGIEAFDYACNMKPTSVKVQIVMPEAG